MTKRRYHTCVDVLGGIKNPKAFCGCITVAGKELNTISEVKRFFQEQLDMGGSICHAETAITSTTNPAAKGMF